MSRYLLVIAILAAVGFARAYRVADRKVMTRNGQIRDLIAELELTREACDRLLVHRRADVGIPADWHETVLDIAHATSPADFEEPK